jgi:hypothetical protein
MAHLPIARAFLGLVLLAGPSPVRGSSIELPGPGDDAYASAASLPAPRRPALPILIRPEELSALVDRDGFAWEAGRNPKPLEVDPKIPIEDLDEDLDPR